MTENKPPDYQPNFCPALAQSIMLECVALAEAKDPDLKKMFQNLETLAELISKASYDYKVLNNLMAQNHILTAKQAAQDSETRDSHAVHYNNYTGIQSVPTDVQIKPIARTVYQSPSQKWARKSGHWR